ncbi:transcriptional regulator, CdaR family [Haloechinothrix alba]|uniref:Transcriptional regulator, CdaR family n=1 Tax=Haloechinothrix alba TaxID=664784 RepID=A0A238Y587_9PSEU|nr:helix-turn-helix domain-containing protein [Haloechinothrix alba]SNR66132.1 transcriptional regulator, CdaR family [Haloechinothrix alba]
MTIVDRVSLESAPMANGCEGLVTSDVVNVDGAPSPPSLRDVLGQVTEQALDVMCAPHGLDVPLRGVLIWDSGGFARIESGDVVLAVGLPTAFSVSQVLRAAARAGAAAVVIKQPDHPSWVRSEADVQGVAVLAAPQELSWDRLYTDLRATVTAASMSVESGERTPVGDLFSLVNAAAAVCSGPVELYDSEMQVLAYSNLDEDTDELRRLSILHRRPPPHVMSWLRDSGSLQRVRGAHRPTRIEPVGHRPRLIVPIRAGVDILGYIWVTVARETTCDATGASLTDIARIASGLLVRLRTAGDTERRMRGELLRGVIEGSGSPEVLAGCLGVDSDESFRLLAFRPRAGDRPVNAHLLIEELVVLRLELAGIRGSAASLGGRVYALVPEAHGTHGETRELAASILDHVENQLRTDAVVAISDALPNLATLPRGRDEVDRVMRLTSGTEGARVTSLEDLRSSVILAELRELMRERAHLLRGAIQRLSDIDKARNVDYVTTLREYFDAQCDLTKASKRLCVHRNTLRYRLGRIQELCGIDINNPTERLVAELQLRLGFGE